jgi:hypothetical protein
MLEDIVTKTNAITITTTSATPAPTPTPETGYPFDYDELQRLAKESIEGLSQMEPTRDANGKPVVDAFEVVRQKFLSIFQRALEIPPPPPGPLELPPGVNEASVRRKIAHLRTLESGADDPARDPRILADTLERRAQIRRIVLGIGIDMLKAMAMLIGIVFHGLAKAIADRLRDGKPLYGPADANDTEGELIRKLLRVRRNFLGRPETSGPKRRKWPLRR